MIDLHIHTIYSDGDKTIEEILKKCEERKLEYISITDHNTCKQYQDKALENNQIFTGKIIKGCELNAVFEEKTIEILAYNVDTNIIDNWSEKYYSVNELLKQQSFNRKRLLTICDQKGLKYDDNNIPKNVKVSDYIEVSIYNELMRYEKNFKILGELAESFNIFFRKGLANPQSDFFKNPSTFRPQYIEVIDIIHKAGGKAFLAHPFEYKFENTIEVMDKLRSKLDGIECYHPSAEINNRKNILIEYARRNNLYISGGSDYHGKRKPDIEIGIGKGSLNISKELVEEWSSTNL